MTVPQSENNTEYNDHNIKMLQKPFLSRQIAPYQVKISFKCGIDLKSFFKTSQITISFIKKLF